MYKILEIIALILLGLITISLPIYMLYLAFSSKNYEQRSNNKEMGLKEPIVKGKFIGRT